MKRARKKILFVFGTRPEAIKLAPLVVECKKQDSHFEVRVCVTGQHKEMLNQVLEFFEIAPDYDLQIMQPNQNLSDLTARAIARLEAICSKYAPHHVVVQGDTTTALSGALVAYYNKIAISHVEAGLRTNDKYSPFPEEGNRILISRLADYHFAPTEFNARALAKEGITENVWVTGNTVIDSLFLALDYIKMRGQNCYFQYFDFLDFENRILLVTAHRRESFGAPMKMLLTALREVCEKFPSVQIVYPLHLNPNISGPARELLTGLKNVFLIEPLDYSRLIWLMNRSYIVLTDSGGIQEEAPSLGKPVLVLREVSERIEGIHAGTARLVGTDRTKIVNEVSLLLNNRAEYENMANSINPYGDGNSSRRIIEVLLKHSS